MPATLDELITRQAPSKTAGASLDELIGRQTPSKQGGASLDELIQKRSQSQTASTGLKEAAAFADKWLEEGAPQAPRPYPYVAAGMGGFSPDIRGPTPRPVMQPPERPEGYTGISALPKTMDIGGPPKPPGWEYASPIEKLVRSKPNQEIAGWLYRFGAQLTNAFAKVGQGILSHPLSPIGMAQKEVEKHLLQARQEIADAAPGLSAGESDILARTRATELAAQEHIKTIEVDPRKGFSDLSADVSAGLASFVIQLRALGYIMPAGTPQPVIWELQNEIVGGIPGEGMAMRTVLGGIGGIPTTSAVGKIGKVGLESGLFAGVAAATGGDAEHIITSAAIPIAFNGWQFAKQRRYITNYEAELKGKAASASDQRIESIDREYNKAIRDAQRLPSGQYNEAIERARANRQRSIRASDSYLADDSRVVKNALDKAKRQIYSDDAFAPTKEKWEREREKALKMIRQGGESAKRGNAILDFMGGLPGPPAEGSGLGLPTTRIGEAVETVKEIAKSIQHPVKTIREAGLSAFPKPPTMPQKPPGVAQGAIIAPEQAIEAQTPQKARAGAPELKREPTVTAPQGRLTGQEAANEFVAKIQKAVPGVTVREGVREGDRTGLLSGQVTGGKLVGMPVQELTTNTEQLQRNLDEIGTRVLGANPQASDTDIRREQQKWVDSAIQEEVIHAKQSEEGLDYRAAEKWEALPKKVRQLMKWIYDEKAAFEGTTSEESPETLYLEYDRIVRQLKETGRMSEDVLRGENPITQALKKELGITPAKPTVTAPQGGIVESPYIDLNPEQEITVETREGTEKMTVSNAIYELEDIEQSPDLMGENGEQARILITDRALSIHKELDKLISTPQGESPIGAREIAGMTVEQVDVIRTAKHNELGRLIRQVAEDEEYFGKDSIEAETSRKLEKDWTDQNAIWATISPAEIILKGAIEQTNRIAPQGEIAAITAYHGTSAENAANIQTEGFRVARPPMPIAPNLVVGIEGVYLSQSKYGAQKFAKTFEKGKVVPANVTLKKPYIIDSLTNKVIGELEDKYVWSKVKQASPQNMSDLLKEGLQAEGYDGIIIKKWQQGGMYAAKEPQIIAFDATSVTTPQGEIAAGQALDDTMVEAIALSSPSGKMSKRARDAANERLRVALFGEKGLQGPQVKQPTEIESLQRRSAMLRDLAKRGMSAKKFTKEADSIDAKIADLAKQAPAPQGEITPEDALFRVGQAQIEVEKAIKKHGFGGITEAEQHPNVVATERVVKAAFNDFYNSLNPKYKIGESFEWKGHNWTITQATFDITKSVDTQIKTGFPSTFDFRGIDATREDGKESRLFTGGKFYGPEVAWLREIDTSQVLKNVIAQATPKPAPAGISPKPIKTLLAPQGEIAAEKAPAKAERKPVAEGELNLATTETLEALGATLKAQSGVSESQYYDLNGIAIRLSEHWGASKALPLLYKGDYGDLLKELVEVKKMPTETKAQRRDEFARRKEVKDAIRKRSQQIWSERIAAIRTAPAKQAPAPTKGKWRAPANMTKDQFHDWLYSKGTPSAMAGSFGFEDQWTYYQEQQAPAPEGKGIGKPGFALVPESIQNAPALVKELILPAEAKIGQLGLAGKKMVVRAIKADEVSHIKAARATEITKRSKSRMTKPERKAFGFAVNYVSWERDPRPPAQKKRGYKLRTPPTSINQRRGAEIFLRLTDAARLEYEGMGGVAKMGGIPFPQRMTKEGLKLYAEAMGAIDKRGKPNFKLLRDNGLIQAMIDDELAGDVGEAYAKLKRMRDHIRRPIYAYMERSKEPLPAKYLEQDIDKIVTHDFWKEMYNHVELARQFGVEHFRAMNYIKEIRDNFGENVEKEVQEWWDRVVGKTPTPTPLQVFSRKLAHAVGQYQVLKLSPLTSLQNFFQRWLSAMEFGPVTSIRGALRAWTPKGRAYARKTGAIPFDPQDAGLIADLKTVDSRAFARAWIEIIGMGTTERGNRGAAANIAAIGLWKDFQQLQNRPGPVGQFVRSLLTLGGESQGATERRLRAHGINWKQALKRGHLTLDELRLGSLREAKSKHFPVDLYTTPTWWQKSPWARQWAKYRIPFAYNMMTKIWKLSATEAAHGNFRPLAAFLLVSTLTGEIYHLWRKGLLGEDRSEMSIVRRLWENIVDGGAVGLFGGMMFGKDIVEKIINFGLGVHGATGKQVLETFGRKIPEAPEHTWDHILELVKREIPTVKYIDQAIHKNEHIREGNRWKIRDAEEAILKKEGDLGYYYEDVYNAAIANDPDSMLKAARKAIEHGATPESILSSMNAKAPSRTPYKERPKLGAELNVVEKDILRGLEREHDVAVARVRVLVGKSHAEYVVGLIETAQNKKSSPGEAGRAQTRLNNLGVSRSQYNYYERQARKQK